MVARLLFALALLAAMPGIAGSALAQGAPKPANVKPSDMKPAETQDTLLERLAAAKDDAEAAAIAERIERNWNRSGSDTSDLLMARATIAMGKNDPALAVELLDRVIALSPGWAEAWNKRATAFHALGDFQRSMLDLSEALKREPRHYGALAGVGIIWRATGNDKQAMQAFRRALAIHPHLTSVKEMVERLAPDVDGRDL